MFEVNCLDIHTENTFKRHFDTELDLNIFLTRLKYSKKVKLISVINYSYLYE